MGNSSSNGLHVNFVAQSGTSAGGELTGTVYLVVDEQRPPEKTTSQMPGKIVLRIQSEQTTSVTYSAGSGDDTRQETDRFHEIMLTFTSEIHSWADGVVPAGTLEIPFSVTLPRDMPPSMRAGGGSDSARISHTATVLLMTGDGRTRAESPAREVIVLPMERALPESDAVFAEPHAVPVTTCWCCGNHGQVMLGAKINHRAVGPIGEVAGTVALVNDSDKPLEVLHCDFYEMITWTANSHRRATNKKLDQAYMPIAKLQVAGVTAKEDQGQRNVEQIALDQLLAGNIKFKLPDFEAIFDLSTSHITITHRVDVWVETALCVTNPRVSIPITVVNPSADRGTVTTSVEVAKGDKEDKRVAEAAVEEAKGDEGGTSSAGTVNEEATKGGEGKTSGGGTAEEEAAKGGEGGETSGGGTAEEEAAKGGEGETSGGVDAEEAAKGGEGGVGGAEAAMEEARDDEQAPLVVSNHARASPDELPQDWKPQRLEPVVAKASEIEYSTVPPERAEQGDQMAQLISDLKKSFRSKSLVEDFIANREANQDMINSTSPSEFAQMLAAVKFSFDRSDIAKQWADAMGPNFTCAHVAAACRFIDDSCVEIVRATAAKASDYPAGRAEIEAELTSFEKMIGCLPDSP